MCTFEDFTRQKCEKCALSVQSTPKNIKKTFVINVVLNTGRKSKYGQDSDFLHIPDHRSYEDAFSALNSLSNGIDGLPDHIASEHGVISSSFVSGHGSAAADELPSLKPDEKVGRCEKYTGSACGASLGAEAMVWVSTDQTYVDERLSLTFQTITTFCPSTLLAHVHCCIIGS